MAVTGDSTDFVCASVKACLLITDIGLEFAGSQKRRKAEANKEKGRFR
jgi:hypothetical protein